MLLSFKLKNYKSFIDEAELDMTKKPKQTELDYSILEENCNKKKIRGLCSSVIYGPNASGKTNIIGAMDVMRAIVLRGNIRDSEDESSPNRAAFLLELIPNNMSEEAEPVEFCIKFTTNGLLIEYALKLDLGSFLDTDYDRKIVSETLFVNQYMIFQREDGLKIGNLANISDYVPYAQGLGADFAEDIILNSLNDEELFLTNGFKLIFSKDLVKIIVDWFSYKFMVIYRSDSMQLIKRFSDPQKKTIYIDKTTNKAAEIFGIGSNALGYVDNKEDNKTILCSMMKNAKGKKNFAIAAEIFESYGTYRFVNLFPLVIKAIHTGGTLVVDEFDASIHPMALMNIINIFHNDEINIHHAQLIFNTHNPIFLNGNIFRRDEIKFVERNKDQASSIYSLADFGTSGTYGVRKGEDYMKNYFVSRYGAIKDIDFTPIFEELIASEKEEKS
ncbi:ATP/GTP-binding protein [uncultured Ruminococcus sp.]|uniref:AAA family ATPase n=1 Tax=uncultured Ruminococcus sp. TaxID=165186 RepID=UPI00266EFE4C|nr:ATP-binding protein [uncultured Ruminococcus sp.]